MFTGINGWKRAFRGNRVAVPIEPRKKLLINLSLITVAKAHLYMGLMILRDDQIMTISLLYLMEII